MLNWQPVKQEGPLTEVRGRKSGHELVSDPRGKWPVPDRRGHPTPARRAHPLDPVARRSSQTWHPDVSWPTFLLAAYVMGSLELCDEEQDLATWAEEVSTPRYFPAEPKLMAAVTVTGALAERPDWSTLDDDALLDLTASQWLAGNGNWTFREMWDATRALARTSEAGERARWAPWWRAACLWPQATELTVFACIMQYLWQHRCQYEPPVSTPEQPWLLESGKPPKVVLTTALTEVLGPDPTAWPWPYSWCTVDTDSAAWTSPSNDPSEPDWLGMTGLTDEELDHLLRCVADA